MIIIQRDKPDNAIRVLIGLGSPLFVDTPLSVRNANELVRRKSDFDLTIASRAIERGATWVTHDTAKVLVASHR